jgi:hypothetical protein
VPIGLAHSPKGVCGSLVFDAIRICHSLVTELQSRDITHTILALIRQPHHLIIQLLQGIESTVFAKSLKKVVFEHEIEVFSKRGRRPEARDSSGEEKLVFGDDADREAFEDVGAVVATVDGR